MRLGVKLLIDDTNLIVREVVLVNGSGLCVVEQIKNLAIII